ncbi:MAG: hypothetical protein V1780_06335 [Chloroflexota bacterium]
MKREVRFNVEVVWHQPVARPLLLVLSSPSGAGKDTVLARLKQLGCPLQYITTVTTRSRRASERNAVDYHLISNERFQQMINRGELLEWANVYGNYYGVPAQPVKQALERGQDTIVKVDVQGAATLKKILPGGGVHFPGAAFHGRPGSQAGAAPYRAA